MAEIIVFGSAIVDFICYVPRLPKTGETLHGTKFSTGYGGKGANQCVAASRLGAHTAMIAKVGDDIWGRNYMDHLIKECVDISFVEQCVGESTGIAQISVSDSGDNHIVIVAGANNDLNSADVTKAKKLFDNAKILICQLETPIDATITALKSFQGLSILNAAPAIVDAQTELLKAATILCVNENEAAFMTGRQEVTTLEQAKCASRDLIMQGANIVIITLGPLGAVYVESSDISKCIHVPAPAVDKVQDTTGAGDAFVGALAYFMAHFQSSPMHQLVGGACAVAAYSVQHFGTQSSFPNLTQVETDLTKKTFNWKLV